MKKYFFISPRSSGKTTKAIYEFTKEPNNTIFISYNENRLSDIHNLLDCDVKYLTTSHKCISKLRCIKPKNIIIDEYMSFDNKDSIYKHIQTMQLDNLYIYSSPNKSYNSDLFYFVKYYKCNMSYQDILIKYGNKLTDSIEKDIYDLYYNFITDDDVIIIKTYNNTISDSRKNELIKQLGYDRYITEYCDNFLV
jgi:hypothetical protein